MKEETKCYCGHTTYCDCGPEQDKMKNIHVLPTDKPSRLYLSDYGKELNLSGYPLRNYTTGQHLYITNDEKPKQGEWSLYQNKPHKCIEDIIGDEFKKIILTTDQDLIKDGVQAIDDDFLFWFINNSSCEEVEFLRCPIEGLYTIILKEEAKQHVELINKNIDEFDSKVKEFKKEQKQHLIDMIKADEELGLHEEPKQETLEEAKQRYAELTYVYPLEKSKTFDKEPQMELLKRQFELGAKWQMERLCDSEVIQRIRANKSDAEARRIIKTI